VSGEASLTVEVEVLFFSESVTLRVKREFSLSDVTGLVQGNPNQRLKRAAQTETWDFVMSQSEWSAYAQAFGSGR
jgi:hypothetical protein